MCVADERRRKSAARAKSAARCAVGLAAGARDLAVLVHRDAVAVDVDGLASLLGELDGELEREAVRGGERERVLAGDRLLTGELVEHLQSRARASRGSAPPRPCTTRSISLGVLDDLGVPRAHLLDDDRGQPVDAVEADAPRLHDRPADQPAQDVAAALVRRGDALRDRGRSSRARGR